MFLAMVVTIRTGYVKQGKTSLAEILSTLTVVCSSQGLNCRFGRLLGLVEQWLQWQLRSWWEDISVRCEWLSQRL